MQNYKKPFSEKSLSIFGIIIFSIIFVIIAILFNLRGNFKASAANNLNEVYKQEINQKQIGYISRVYEKDGKRYLNFDDVDFLTGEKAVEAAKKEGNAILQNGKYYVLDDYYIVNENKVIKEYAIDDYAILNLLGFMVSNNGDDITNTAVDYEKFKFAINNNNYPKLCYIYLKGNTIIKVEGQYVP